MVAIALAAQTGDADLPVRGRRLLAEPAPLSVCARPRAERRCRTRSGVRLSGAPADQAAGREGTERQPIARRGPTPVTFYANGLSKQDAVFDRDLINVTKAMRVLPTATTRIMNVDAALVATLGRAAPIYRRVWWPRHQQANHDRVREFARSPRRTWRQGAGVHHERVSGILAGGRVSDRHERLHELGRRVFDHRRVDRDLESRSGHVRDARSRIDVSRSDASMGSTDALAIVAISRRKTRLARAA